MGSVREEHPGVPPGLCMRDDGKLVADKPFGQGEVLLSFSSHDILLDREDDEPCEFWGEGVEQTERQEDVPRFLADSAVILSLALPGPNAPFGYVGFDIVAPKQEAARSLGGLSDIQASSCVDNHIYAKIPALAGMAHSGTPNCVLSVPLVLELLPSMPVVSVHASRGIAQGEELTVSRINDLAFNLPYLMLQQLSIPECMQLPKMRDLRPEIEEKRAAFLRDLHGRGHVEWLAYLDRCGVPAIHSERFWTEDARVQFPHAAPPPQHWHNEEEDDDDDACSSSSSCDVFQGEEGIEEGDYGEEDEEEEGEEDGVE